MAELLVIADDLTGALDTGAQFARYGLRTLVTWGAAPPGEAGVWVVDTESRDQAPGEARRRVIETAGPLIPLARRLYKKVDSTLRGNVGAEIEALLEQSGAPQILLAPAFPAQGRTTVQGRQWVHGVPLDATPFAQPGCDCSSITALLAGQMAGSFGCVDLATVRQGARALAAHLALRAERVLVVDAEDDADLANVAEAAVRAGRDGLLAGSAGLAAHLPAAWGRPPVAAARPTAGVQGPVLVVAGTKHPCLGEQLACLSERAAPRVVGQVLAAAGEAHLAGRAEALAKALAEGHDAVLTSYGEALVAGAGRSVAETLAGITARALQKAQTGALVLTGGDVAMAVCTALGAEAIAVEGEVEPGIPCGRLVGGRADGLPVVTKAGGFGRREALWRAVAALREAGGPGH